MGKQAEVVILGAGILGCALAWRLAARNVCRGESILVVDPNPALSQATGRAAALLSLARPSTKAHWIPLVQRTLKLAGELEHASHCVPVHRVGAIHLAGSAQAKDTLADFASAAAAHGVACERVDPQDFAERLPWLAMRRFTDALWFPDERYTDPYLLGSAYAAAARALGVRFQFGKAASLRAIGNRIAIEIDATLLKPNSVWLAAGAWCNSVLRPLGTGLAQAAVRSQYWITQPTPLATRAMPMVSVAEAKLYARPEMGAILFGLREAHGIAAASTRLPRDLAGFAFDPEDSAGYATLEACSHLLEDYAPGLMGAGLRHYVSGPSCYTPDGDFLLGAVADWDNFKVLSGCNGAGIAASAGLADLAASCETGANDPAPAYRPMRFGNVDPDAPALLRSCIAARSGKCGG